MSALAAGSLAALVVERPLALGLLALAAAALLAERLRPRAEPQASATLELWRRARAQRGGEAPGRPRPPAWRVLLALGLACGALALADPRLARAPRARALVVALDTSPSMHLPFVAPGAGGELQAPPGSARPTRLAQALARARELLAELAAREPSAPRVVWRTWSARGVREHAGAEPPADWLAPERAGVEPPWEALDRPDTLWVTDRALAPRAAGQVACGGAAVPGPIGIAPEREARPGAAPASARVLVWDGTRVHAGEPAPPQRVATSGSTPAPLAALLEAWCGARGLALVTADERDRREGGALALLVEGPAPDGPVLEGVGAEQELALGRDGWHARARVAAAGAAGSGEVWLAAEEPVRAGLALVRVEPGRVTHALLALALAPRPDEPPEAFALSWATLLERALLPAPGSVPLAERLAAGAPALREPARAARASVARTGEEALAAKLALAGALAAAGAALALASRGRARAQARAAPSEESTRHALVLKTK